LGTLWGTCHEWELFATIPRTPTQKKKKKRKVKSRLCTPNTTWKKKTPPPPYPQDRKGRTLRSMTRLLIGCMEILFLKLATILFWLGPTALLKNTQSILGNLFFWGTYFCFVLISLGCLTSSTFFSAMSYFDWPIAKKIKKLWRLPQNRRFYWKMKCVPQWALIELWTSTLV